MKLGVRYVCCMLLAALALWGTTGCGAGDPIAMSFGGAKVTKSMYAYWYGPTNTDEEGIIVDRAIKLITNNAIEKP